MNRQKAVFLDRDGTVNREVNVLRGVRQLRLLSGAADAIRALNRAGFLVIIVTNQPVIARGWLTESQVDDVHEELLRRLARRGASVETIYYCPHHPKANLKKYRKRCRCRKPQPGMLLDAMKAYGIDRRKSFMVGDHAWDVLAGKAAGLATVLVHSSSRSRDPAFAHVRPDHEAKNLAGAVHIIKKHAT